MSIQTQSNNQAQPPQIAQVPPQNVPAVQRPVVNQQAAQQPNYASNQSQILQSAQQSGQQHFIGQQQRGGQQQGNQRQQAQQPMQALPQQRNAQQQPPLGNQNIFRNNGGMTLGSTSQGCLQNNRSLGAVSNPIQIPSDSLIKKNEHCLNMLAQILQFNLHLDPDYTSIYGIWHTLQYLQDAKNRFTTAYQYLLQTIHLNDKLVRWYEMITKEFHQKFGIPTVLDPNWWNLTQKISVLTVQCTLTLNHSHPATNLALMLNAYNYQFKFYREAIKDQKEQQALMTVLQHLTSKESVDINSIFQMSALGGFNIMVHQKMIPSQHPILIMNGQEVPKEKFPKYCILQLFTMDKKLFYGLSLNEFDKSQLDQYIHYDVKIQHINYSQEAQQVLNNLKEKEGKVYQQAMDQSQTERLNVLNDICKKKRSNKPEEGQVQHQQGPAQREQGQAGPGPAQQAGPAVRLYRAQVEASLAGSTYRAQGQAQREQGAALRQEVPVIRDIFGLAQSQQSPVQRELDQLIREQGPLLHDQAPVQEESQVQIVANQVEHPQQQQQEQEDRQEEQKEESEINELEKVEEGQVELGAQTVDQE
ncbi:hypothetical protein pb186bvf_018945 [Paramecium bursaria]